MELQQYKLTKLSDDKFKGNHPNNIFKGYIKEGSIYPSEPKVGESFYCGSLGTSTVTEPLNSDGVFKTKNSTYKLEKM